MSNSPLVNHVKLSPNKYQGRGGHKIDTITPHCVVGQASVESLGALFAKSSRRASSNYGIGPDGRIGLYVDEKDTSWCSSSRSNDSRAITIEVASDVYHPYAITDAAYNALIDLCYDVCKRNGIAELRWKADKSLIGQVKKQNITVHRWFANKACPGDYIYNRLGAVANAVNKKLKNDQNDSQSTDVPFVVKVDVGSLNVRSGPGTNYKKKPGHLAKGAYTIVEVSSGAGSKIGWGRLKSGAGWISLDYVNRIEG